MKRAAFEVTVGGPGIQDIVRSLQGQSASFESDVRLTGEDSFQETGSITFGAGGHSLRFATVGAGHIAAGADPRYQHGAVIWRISGGEGLWAGASGLITSNFTIDEHNDVTDHQFAVIWIPER